jgi:UDP-glucose 4,6-dehydratase
MHNILITGGYGFIGSELVNVTFQQINELNRLIVLDRLDYCSDQNNVLESIRNHACYKFIKGDLCDYNLLEKILSNNNIDTVIHMAAQSHVDLSFTNSFQFTQDNVLGTHTLLEACRKYGNLKKFIHMSTDEVYGETSHEEKHANKEIALLDPTNPYAASKAAAEFYVRAYGYSYNIPYIIIRGNNVYGHGQYPDKLISKFIFNLHMDKPLPIHGDGSSKRTFIYVTDMAKGILTVVLKGIIGEIYNIGSYNEYSVLEISNILCKLMGKNKENYITYVADRQFNDKRYFIDHSKIALLGWKEETSFEEGLIKTINWYKYYTLK